MGKYKYGIQTCIIGNIDPATGGVVALSAVDILEDIYRDTFNLAQTTGTETEHFSEMNDTPKLKFSELGSRTITFQLLDTRPESLARFLGGTVVTANGKNTWSAPTVTSLNEKHMVLTLLDGTEITMPRASVQAATNFQIRRNAPALLDVTITPLSPEFSGLSAFSVSEPVV